MKWITAIVLALALTACGGQSLHKPTTAGNAGTTALVAYFAANRAAVKYIELPRCATPRVLPCSDQAVVDKIAAADTAAYDAAKAADAAGASAQAKADAETKLNKLKEETP